MSKKDLYYLGIIAVYLIGLFYHIQLFYGQGRASVFSTFYLYTLLGLFFGAILFLAQKWFLKRTTYLNTMLLVSSSLVFLFIGELSLRYVFKTGLTYKEKNGYFHYISPSFYTQNTIDRPRLHYPPNTQRFRKKKEFAYQDQFNNFGLRDRFWAPEVFADTQLVRILALGDSFTEGTGVQQDSTWLRFLEKELNEASTDKKLFTINGGISGSDPITDYLRYKERLTVTQPHIVILSVNFSDVQDISLRGGFERLEPGYQLPDAPWWEPLFASSLIFRGFAHLVFGYSQQLIAPRELERISQQAKKDIITAIEAFKTLASKHSFTFILTLNPLQNEIIKQESAMQFLADQYLQDSSVYLLNLYEKYTLNDIINANNISEYYWTFDGHHNAKGYQLWADQLSQLIQEEKLLDQK